MLPVIKKAGKGIMRILHIVFVFITKLWTLIPAFVTDPFDVIERVGKMINQNFSFNPSNWIFWVLLIGGLLLAGYLTYRELKKESTTSDHLEDIKDNLVEMNNHEQTAANRRIKTNLAKSKADEIRSKITIFVGERASKMLSSNSLTTKEQIVDEFINLMLGIADVLDSYNYGLKSELTDNLEYNDAIVNISQKQHKLGKKKRLLIQTHIKKAMDLTYGVNSVIIFRYLYRQSPEFMKKVPVQYNLFVERAEKEGRDYLRQMLEHFDEDWEQLIKIDDLSDLEGVKVG